MFSIQSPLKPKSYGLDKGIIVLTQLFGENDLDYSKLGLLGHNGIDFRTKHFDKGFAPCYASHDGYVISDKNTQSDTAGRFVKLISDEIEIDGKKCKVMTMYFHLSEARVSSTDPEDSRWFCDKGRKVKAGTLIGTCGNTGQFTSGSHLHFGMYILWKDEKGNYTANNSNGYDGAVDPLPYFRDNWVMQCGDSLFGRKFFFNGKKIERKEIDNLIKKYSN